MDGWWRKNPYFVEYMIHEATALFVALYALILLAGVVCLPMDAMRGRLGDVGLESAVHLSSPRHPDRVRVSRGRWFHIMPRTLPPIRAGGKRVAGTTITRAG